MPIGSPTVHAHLHRFTLPLLLALSTLWLAGCGVAEKTFETAHSLLPEVESLPELPGVYRLDIQQGNIITQDMIDQLRVGMEPRKVRFILGTPSLVDTFNANRWDYYYSLKRGTRDPEVRRVSVYFDNAGLQRLTTYGEIPKGDNASGDGPRKERVVVVPPRTDDGTIFGSLFGLFTGDDLPPLPEADTAKTEPSDREAASVSTDAPADRRTDSNDTASGSAVGLEPTADLRPAVTAAEAAANDGPQFLIANQPESDASGERAAANDDKVPAPDVGSASAPPATPSTEDDEQVSWFGRMLRDIGLSGQSSDSTQ
ncbi:MAG: outer membrane protein assembly factor BamE [Gammaproteobacteria bacterium]|nr:outer membrane protein assembly factor BamE [Gammaproteobacteria bacterium]